MPPNRIRRFPLAATLLPALGLLLPLAGCTAPAPTHARRFDQEAVAADHELASRAGAEILRQGGNAVDAAVATSFTLSVVRPYSCGIGGGGFMVLHLPDPRSRAKPAAVDLVLNYRETAPAAVGPDYYETLPDAASTYGAKAVGVPGTVAGLLHAHRRFGRLDRAAVLAPAIRVADSGFAADAHYVSAANDLAAKFRDNPDWQTRFPFVWDRYLRRGQVAVGDHIAVPEQAVVLRLIAQHGEAGFYEGPVAEAIVRAIAADAGPMTAEDLRGYTVADAEPLGFSFRGRQFLTMPPPSSGGICMAQALGILSRILPAPPEPINIDTNVAQLRDALDAANRSTRAVRAYGAGPVYLHALTESLKHAFADRSRWLGDPAFTDIPQDRLLSPEYLDTRARTFQSGRTLEPSAYGTPEPLPADGGTSHFCVIDRWGNAVACTETINLEFGSCIAVEPYGFVLNNEMDDFTTRRGRANAFGLRQSDRNLPAPGKRPLSSMTPTIILDARGRVELIAGASGGPRIITGTMQSILNVLLFNDPAGDAVARPRIHHQWSPDKLRLEDGLLDGEWSALGPWVPGGTSTLSEALRQRGHTIERIPSVGEVQMIRRRGEGSAASWEAACDPRKGGRPAGR